MGKSIFTSFILLIGISSCQQSSGLKTYNYGSEIDSAVIYFNKGWEYILDYGQWTLSEESFRKAVELDSNFILGKSLVGKISRDLDERMEITAEIERKKHLVTKDDLLLLEITMKTLQLFNARDKKEEIEAEFIKEFYEIGESNYRNFVHKYPKESYMKAEYIEFIHANKGAELALDSLRLLTSESQKSLPFFITYGALLEAEMGNFTIALSTAEEFSKSLSDPEIPAPYVLFGQIYTQMDSFETARKYIDVALNLDTNHIIAQRLKNTIYSELNISE